MTHLVDLLVQHDLHLSPQTVLPSATPQQSRLHMAAQYTIQGPFPDRETRLQTMSALEKHHSHTLGRLLAFDANWIQVNFHRRRRWFPDISLIQSIWSSRYKWTPPSDAARHHWPHCRHTSCASSTRPALTKLHRLLSRCRINMNQENHNLVGRKRETHLRSCSSSCSS